MRAISDGSMVTVNNLDGEIDPIFYSLIYLSITSSESSISRVNGMNGILVALVVAKFETR